MEEALIRVDKAWGFEQILVNTPLYCAKFLHVQPGKKCSLHYHKFKDETFYVLDGECGLQTSAVDPSPLPILKKGDSRHIPPGLPHRFSSLRGCILLEVSTHHDDSDVIRLEPSGDIPDAPSCFPVKFNPDLKAKNVRTFHIPATNPRDERGAQSGPDVPHSS